MLFAGLCISSRWKLGRLHEPAVAGCASGRSKRGLAAATGTVACVGSSGIDIAIGKVQDGGAGTRCFLLLRSSTVPCQTVGGDIVASCLNVRWVSVVQSGL